MQTLNSSRRQRGNGRFAVQPENACEGPQTCVRKLTSGLSASICKVSGLDWPRSEASSLAWDRGGKNQGGPGAQRDGQCQRVSWGLCGTPGTRGEVHTVATRRHAAAGAASPRAPVSCSQRAAPSSPPACAPLAPRPCGCGGMGEQRAVSGRQTLALEWPEGPFVLRLGD